MTRLQRWPQAVAAVLFSLLAVSASQADERTAQPQAAIAPLPAYTAECGACHIAFPSYLLSAASWTRLMAKLPNHYGSDASLDAPTTQAIAAWLQAHAATGRRAQEQPADDRITRSAWFVREHDEVPNAAWARASIKSSSNCAACHSRAAQGNFNERDTHIPR